MSDSQPVGDAKSVDNAKVAFPISPPRGSNSQPSDSPAPKKRRKSLTLYPIELGGRCNETFFNIGNPLATFNVETEV